MMKRSGLRHFRKWLAQLSVGIAALSFAPVGVAGACTLPPDSERTIAKLYDKATAVVIARVTETRLLDYVNDELPERVVVSVKYQTREVFKGKPHKTGTAITSSYMMCGAGFIAVVGEEYLLYAMPIEPVIAKDRAFQKAAAGNIGMIYGLGSGPVPDAKTLAELRALAARK